MNNIFSIKRFSSYFLYDLRNAWRNFGLSLLVCGFIPLIAYFVVQIFSYIFDGSFIQDATAVRITSLSIALMVVILAAPSKIYGRLTDRRAGKNFVLLPASVTEKFVSMMLTLLVVLPVCLLILFCSTDLLLSVLFPANYGESLIALLPKLQEFNQTMAIDEGIQINMMGIATSSWVSSILAMLLGAVCFRKAKVAKTILALILIGIVFGMLTGFFFDVDYIEGLADKVYDLGPEYIVSTFNWFHSIMLAIQVIICAGGTFYRLKTIKL